jgi:hypothetical protein
MLNSSNSRKIILFEMNEVPFKIIDYFVSKKRDSHLAKILASSKQMTTICEDQVELDPWISWPTLHRGVIDQSHKIFHLGQSLDAANQIFPPVWKLLADEGFKVGVFGSLHSSAIPSNVENYCFYVPDFFDDKVFSYPKSLESFQRLNLVMTRESARNVSSKIPIKEALLFFQNYIAQGMSLNTLSLIASQLLSEFSKPHLKSRRRAVQPAISMDIFLSLLKKTLPDFTTFYTNHVAAAMHRYWTAAFPDDIPNNMMSMQWCGKYEDEIYFSMNILDQMLGKLKKIVDKENYILMITSSLGQAAIRSEESVGFLTITEISVFMTAIGLKPHEWKLKNTMVPSISVIVDDDKADFFQNNLKMISADGHKMIMEHKEVAPLSFDRQGDNSFQIFVLFEINQPPSAIKLGDKPMNLKELGIGMVANQDNVTCSGRHTPFGSLLIYDPLNNSVSEDRTSISTLDIVPAILNNFGVSLPSYLNTVDPCLLDVTTRKSNISLRVSGGGVETPVERKHQQLQVD